VAFGTSCHSLLEVEGDSERVWPSRRKSVAKTVELQPVLPRCQVLLRLSLPLLLGKCDLRNEQAATGELDASWRTTVDPFPFQWNYEVRVV
jgi:hypothetical protein